MNPATCACNQYYFLDTSQSLANMCQPCHIFCLACDTTSTHCTSCKNLLGVRLVGNTCECNPNGYFIDSSSGTDTCTSCDPRCIKCTGKENLLQIKEICIN